MPPGCALNHATKRCMNCSCLTTPPVQGCLKLETLQQHLVHLSAGLSEPWLPWVPWHPPYFCRSVNPISTRQAGYAHHIKTGPPDFKTFLRPCCLLLLCGIEARSAPKILPWLHQVDFILWPTHFSSAVSIPPQKGTKTVKVVFGKSPNKVGYIW